jgi:glutathione S-transferase
MMVTVLRIAARGKLLAPFPNLAAYVARGEARPAFKQALEDQLATFREHEPQGEAA